jgi:hypothetical protein
MKIECYAPVLIPTLNRYEHLKRCVESLSKCTHADKTELVIGLDYPPSEEYVEGWKKICDYVQNISGFAVVTVLKRDYNYGVLKNFRDIKEYASKKYDRFIISEDDNEFSPNFLDYINKGLEIYKDNPNIYAICGYNYPIDMSGYEFEYYFSHEFAGWGYGSWFEKQEKVFKIIQSPKYVIDFYKSYPLNVYFKNNFKLMYLATCIGDGFLGDVYLTSYLHSRNMFTVFPKESKVRNWGHDGSGANCGILQDASFYSSQPIDGRSDFVFENIPFSINKKINRRIVSFKNIPFKSKIRVLLLFVLVWTYVRIK